MTARALILASVCGLGVALSATHAKAFCRASTCDPSKGDDCTTDSNGCVVGGLPLFWRSSCVTFAVQRDGSKKLGIDAPALEQVGERAFRTWMEADCGAGKTPSIRVDNLGEVECREAHFNESQGNANVLLFEDDDWMSVGSARAYAITFTKFRRATGEILDSDVVINGTAPNITNGAPQDGADLPSIVTHETGHFLGLAHAPDPLTTMYLDYDAGGRSLRELARDDMAGICAVYPPDRAAQASDCGPYLGFQSACEHEEGCGCRVAPARARGSSFVGIVTGLALALMARRRLARS